MPFIPFIIGAAVGGAITYVAKDDSSKDMLKDTGDKITGGVGVLTGKVSGMFKKSEDAVEEVVADASEETEDVVAA